MTAPLPEPEPWPWSRPERCAWCNVRLAAVPDPPVEFQGQRYHQGGCVAAARTKASLSAPAEFEPWSRFEPWDEPEPEA